MEPMTLFTSNTKKMEEKRKSGSSLIRVYRRGWDFAETLLPITPPKDRAWGAETGEHFIQIFFLDFFLLLYRHVNTVLEVVSMMVDCIGPRRIGYRRQTTNLKYLAKPFQDADMT